MVDRPRGTRLHGGRRRNRRRSSSSSSTDYGGADKDGFVRLQKLCDDEFLKGDP